MTDKRIEEIKRKNKNIAAKFFALSVENVDNKKCMITFTANDETYTSTKVIRNAFIAKVVSIMKRKQYSQNAFNYFANIEFGKDPYGNFNPHLHIQCFYDEIAPLQEAFDHIIDKYQLDGSKCDLSIADNNEIRFNYVIKDYLSHNFNLELEEMKENIYKGKSMHSSSRKEIPNYMIRPLYSILSMLPGWKTAKDKYTFILGLLNQGILSVKKISNTFKKGYRRIKNWLYKITPNTQSTETHPHKISIKESQNTMRKATTRSNKTQNNIPNQRYVEGLVVVLMLILQLFSYSNYSKDESKPEIHRSIGMNYIISPLDMVLNAIH